ncbi:hypothetical protein PGT21_002384 [Puccinia graminis f. sp. tritici]|uniref:Uncharacterized protein n=1 Tax=Puccinia graminis f. sp. tritici TaxID=56615 RepID=A0A5B0QSP2_PUCGR|nr:hypothetical protein PGT21_002384 [Puccinia graminis f. sp. tritici]KAA1134704.1 hypothetical protein PGTUg99_006260 [Puccinia graminis f. sp. tritici]
MLGERIKALVRLSILLDLLVGIVGTTALDVNLPASINRRSMEDESLLLHLENQGESIGVGHPSSKYEKIDSSDVGQTKNQVEKLNNRLKQVEITTGRDGVETEETSSIGGKDGKHILSGASGGETLVK